MSLTQTMGRLVAETPAEVIPNEVIGRAKISVLHNLVVGLAGRTRESVAHVMAETVWAIPAEATLLWSGARVSIEGAAFANAALMNARSQDDTHAASTSHPGSPTMAAALAVGEAAGCSGPEFLAASVLGYEVLGRIGRGVDHLITGRGLRAAIVLAGFGAAASAARLLRLTGEQCAHALGLVTHVAGGTAQVWREGSAEAPLQMGFATRNGIACARAAQAGGTAARFALEGPGGFYRAYAGEAAVPGETLHGIGRNWQMSEVTVKKLPVCAILQGPVGVLIDLMDQQAIAADAIAAVDVALSPYEAAYPGIDFGGPFSTSIATKMSAQFSMALAALHRRVTPDGLERVSDERILALAKHVTVTTNPAITPRLSAVSVTLRDGRVLRGAVDAPVGQPGFAEAARFARGLAPEMGATEAEVDRVIMEVEGLDRAPDLRGLLDAAAMCGTIAT